MPEKLGLTRMFRLMLGTAAAFNRQQSLHTLIIRSSRGSPPLAHNECQVLVAGFPDYGMLVLKRRFASSKEKGCKSSCKYRERKIVTGKGAKPFVFDPVSHRVENIYFEIPYTGQYTTKPRVVFKKQ